MLSTSLITLFASAWLAASTSAADTDALESDVQGCVRDHTADMIEGGTYEHLAKLTACVADGMEALHDGKAPPDVAQQIADCVNGKPFPDSLQDSVNDFLDCVKSKLS